LKSNAPCPILKKIMLSRFSRLTAVTHSTTITRPTAITVTLLTAFMAVFAIQAQTESIRPLLWRFVAGGQIRNAPALSHNSIIYLPADDRSLYAVYPNGELKWSYKGGYKFAGSPVIGYDGTVYIATVKGALLALAPNGRVRWSFRAPAAITGTPAIGSDGTIYLPVSGGLLYALTYSGKEKWHYQYSAEICSSPSIGPDGSIYLGAENRRLLAMDRQGHKKWEVTLPGAPGTAAIGADGTIYVNGYGIHALSPAGLLLWSYSIPEKTADPIIGEHGIITAGAQNGRLYLIDPEGKKIRHIQLGAPVNKPAAAARDGTIYAVAANTLYAINPSGDIQWTFTTKREAAAPALAEDGTLYLGSADWILYAIGGAHGGMAESSWPIHLHDPAHTGRFNGLGNLENPAFWIIRARAYSGSEELKLKALKEIEQYLKGEDFKALYASSLESILEYLVLESVVIRNYYYGKLIHNFPLVRLKSCSLLAELGTERTRNILLEVLKHEPDSHVKGAAALGLGRIARPSDNEVVLELVHQLKNQSAEVSFHLTLLKAFDIMVSQSEKMLDPAAYRAIIGVAQGSSSARVRKEASALLTRLTRGSGREQ